MAAVPERARHSPSHATRVADCPEIELVHINETPGALESSAYLLEFDSVHGRWPHKVETTADAIVIDGKTVTYSMHKEVRMIPCLSVYS